MSILINKQSRILVQGITGKEGLFHTEQMRLFGSNIVAGIAPGKGGGWVIDNKIPIFDSVSYAIETTAANTSVIFVPAQYATDAIIESINAGIELIVCITEGIPIKDMLIVRSLLTNSKSRLIGPNTPGILSPEQSKVGIIPEPDFLCWQCRGCLPLRYTNLRSGQCINAGWHWCEYLCRYRW